MRARAVTATRRAFSPVAVGACSIDRMAARLRRILFGVFDVGESLGIDLGTGGPQCGVVLHPARRPSLEGGEIGVGPPHRRMQRPGKAVVLPPHEHGVVGLELGTNRVEEPRQVGRREPRVAGQELEGIGRVGRGVHPAAHRVVAAQVALAGE